MSVDVKAEKSLTKLPGLDRTRRVLSAIVIVGSGPVSSQVLEQVPPHRLTEVMKRPP